MREECIVLSGMGQNAQTNLISDEHRDHLRSEFREKLRRPVRILMFTQEIECRFCSETRRLLRELASLSDMIKVEFYDFVANADKAKEFQIDKVPAIAILSEKDYGIRFYGFPYGYEFNTLLEDVFSVSRGSSDLMEETKIGLREVKTPVHVQVFVTLTCTHCPTAAAMAHKFAIENEHIRADVIDVAEFTPLAVKYSIVGVPKTVINDKIEFAGAIPEDLFLTEVLLATT